MLKTDILQILLMAEMGKNRRARKYKYYEDKKLIIQKLLINVAAIKVLVHEILFSENVDTRYDNSAIDNWYYVSVLAH